MSERYNFEHVFLPAVFYGKTGLELMRGLIESHSLCLVEYFKAFIANQLGKPRTVACPYSETNTSVRVHYIPGEPDLCVVQINLPEPAIVPECKCIFLLCEPGGTSKDYITLEKTFDEQFVFCSWTNNKVHLNYGRPVSAGEEFFAPFVELFCRTTRDINDNVLPAAKNGVDRHAKEKQPIVPVAGEQSKSDNVELDAKPVVDLKHNTPEIIEKQKQTDVMESSDEKKLYCRRCGHQLPEDSSFCMFCGEKVITIL